jgi:oligoendopeptidase F
MQKIHKNYTWDLSPLLNSDTDATIEEKRSIVEKKNRAFVKKWKKRTDYLQDPHTLQKALDEYEQLCNTYGHAGPEEYYFWLRNKQNQNDPVLKAKENNALEFLKNNVNETLFFKHSIAKIPPKEQKKFLHSEHLQKYKHFLEHLFKNAQYQLSEPEEKILNLLSGSAHKNWVQMTSGLLAKEVHTVLSEDGKQVKKSFSEILKLTMSKKKAVRNDAWNCVTQVLEKHVDVAEVELNSILGTKKSKDMLRGMQRPETSRHNSDDVNTDVVDTLVSVVSSRFAIAQEYYALKAKLMGVTTLAYHERNVQYGVLNKKYTFEEATVLLKKTFSAINPIFAEILDDFVTKRRVDVYPKKGKHAGAFCVHNLKAQPIYLLLNYTDTLKDVLTFAHELGHGINHELIRRSQHALNFKSPLSTAEVASTFMEDFVLEKLLTDVNEEERLAILMHKLDGDVGTIFRQIACYMFEQELHKMYREKGYLSKKEIGTLFQNHMGAYMGKHVAQSKGSENYWVHWRHIRSFFYVYSYANGLLISKNLQRTLKKDPEFIEKITEFFSTGASLSPKDIFSKLGIDITQKQFWDTGLDEVESLLKQTRALAKKLGKI